VPYIKRERRQDFTSPGHPETAGEINYLFTKIALKYIEDKGESYQAYNDIAGAVHLMLLELERRRIGIYEDEAILRNGDLEGYGSLE
jgi:hypothetical protein